MRAALLCFGMAIGTMWVCAQNGVLELQGYRISAGNGCGPGVENTTPTLASMFPQRYDCNPLGAAGEITNVLLKTPPKVAVVNGIVQPFQVSFSLQGQVTPPRKAPNDSRPGPPKLEYYVLVSPFGPDCPQVAYPAGGSGRKTVTSPDTFQVDLGTCRVPEKILNPTGHGFTIISNLDLQWGTETGRVTVQVVPVYKFVPGNPSDSSTPAATPTPPQAAPASTSGISITGGGPPASAQPQQPILIETNGRQSRTLKAACQEFMQVLAFYQLVGVSPANWAHQYSAWIRQNYNPSPQVDQTLAELQSMTRGLLRAIVICGRELGTQGVARIGQPAETVPRLELQLLEGRSAFRAEDTSLASRLLAGPATIEPANGAEYTAALIGRDASFVTVEAGEVRVSSSGRAEAPLRVPAGHIALVTPQGVRTTAVSALQAPASACPEPLSCAQCLGGGIRQKWLSLGAERSNIGCPVTPELAAAPSRQGTTGRFAQFGGGEGAYIIWHSTGPKLGQAYVVDGCLFKIYHSNGGTTSPLGFPLGDAYAIPGGIRQDFEGGSIRWDSATRNCSASLTAPGGAPSACSGGFAGTWDGGGGLMLRLSVNGNQASGTYSDPRAWQGDATLTGTVNGRALEGQWFNPLLRGNTRNRGPVRFDLSPDGRSFTGYWREADGTGGGQWIGNCVGQAATAACGEPLSCTQCLGGGIRQKWLALGGERGRIGCPTTPELAAAPSPQGTTGRFAQFGGGDGAYIVWHSTGPKTGQAFVVEGCLFKSYHASGGTTSAIGFPVSDAYSVSGGVRQDFEGGYMAWNASTGQCWAHPAGSGGAQPSCSGGFAGTWDGGGGLVLQLSVTGDQATGTYTDPRGWQGNAMLSGTVRGRVLEGQWFNPILRGNSRNRGPVRFELAPDGRSFSGYWREEDGTGGANWTGSCTAGAARQPEAQANFGGVWACGGTLSVRMTQNGSQAQGTYQDTAAWQGSATVSGTVRGNVLEGRWFNQAYRGATRNTGPVRFEMSPNGNAWTGYWREADGSGGGGWNCSRVAGP